jgi:DeoR/GlpR family transcriptional regulator of sugar metabolism
MKNLIVTKSATASRYTTKQLAARFRTTTRTVRRALRSIRNDGQYTRYNVTSKVAEKVGEVLAA